MTIGWEIKEELDHGVDVVIDAGETPAEPTTVVDWSEGVPEVIAWAPATPAASRSDRPRAGERRRRLTCSRSELEVDAVGEAGQAQDVADDEGPGVHGESGDHGLDDSVGGVRDEAGRDEAGEGEHREHQQRREHADGEEVGGAHPPGDRHARGRRSRGRRRG